MARAAQLARIALSLIFIAPTLAQDQPFRVVSTVDQPAIAGRPVALDAQGNLLPCPKRFLPYFHPPHPGARPAVSSGLHGRSTRHRRQTGCTGRAGKTSSLAD